MGDIFSKIFPASHPASSGPAASGATASAAPPVANSPGATAPGVSTTGTTPMPEVDVEQMLDQRAQQSGEKLNWKTSIVDLMKLLGLDSSLTARKQLAKELNYTGDTNDSATMNSWLHRQVMSKVAANGGKVPADLK